MKDKDIIIKDLISKIISIGNVSTMAGGYITIDYRMFCDLISIARCGSDTINDKQSDKILSALEDNVLGYTNEEKSKFMMSFSEYKKLKNKY
jgi:hypothetical protein